MNKDTFRRNILSKRMNFLNSGEFEEYCNRISKNIQKFISEQKITTHYLLGGYSCIKGEPDLTNFYQNCKNIAFPRLLFIKNNSHIEYASIASLQDLTKSKFGFLEPPKSSIICYPDLILVPGICFDRNKRRIGYGKGHFDKYISHAKKLNYNPIKIGICFDFQLQDSLPSEAHDQNMDYIITESTII